MLTEAEILAYTTDIPADIQRLKSEPPVRISDGLCRVKGCGSAATQKVKRGRFTVQMCDRHAGEPTVIKIEEYQKPTTGYKECNRDIDHAVDHALLRLKPIIRDILLEELKRNLKLEEADL